MRLLKQYTLLWALSKHIPFSGDYQNIYPSLGFIKTYSQKETYLIKSCFISSGNLQTHNTLSDTFFTHTHTHLHTYIQTYIHISIEIQVRINLQTQSLNCIFKCLNKYLHKIFLGFCFFTDSNKHRLKRKDRKLIRNKKRMKMTFIKKDTLYYTNYLEEMVERKTYQEN